MRGTFDLNTKIVDTITIGILIALIATFAYGVSLRLIWGSWPDAASFGSSFGALACVLSALAFVAALITLQLQRRQIQISHDQLRMALQLQLITTFLSCDAIPEADRARIAQPFGKKVAEIAERVIMNYENSANES